MSLNSILIVDDSLSVRLLLKNYYAELGITDQTEAGNGVEALEMLQLRSFDVISLDIIMPEMDGVECLKEIKELNIPSFILVCSYLSEEPKMVANLVNFIPIEQIILKNFDDISQRMRLKNLFSSVSINPKVEKSA